MKNKMKNKFILAPVWVRYITLTNAATWPTNKGRQLNHELAHPDDKIPYITISLDRHLVLPSTISYLSLCDPYLKEQYIFLSSAN
jgi:hypothetical protein